MLEIKNRQLEQTKLVVEIGANLLAMVLLNG